MYSSLIPEISDIALQLRCEACTKLQVEILKNVAGK